MTSRILLMAWLAIALWPNNGAFGNDGQRPNVNSSAKSESATTVGFEDSAPGGFEELHTEIGRWR